MMCANKIFLHKKGRSIKAIFIPKQKLGPVESQVPYLLSKVTFVLFLAEKNWVHSCLPLLYPILFQAEWVTWFEMPFRSLCSAVTWICAGQMFTDTSLSSPFRPLLAMYFGPRGCLCRQVLVVSTDSEILFVANGPTINNPWDVNWKWLFLGMRRAEKYWQVEK